MLVYAFSNDITFNFIFSLYVHFSVFFFPTLGLFSLVVKASKS